MLHVTTGTMISKDFCPRKDHRVRGAAVSRVLMSASCLGFADAVIVLLSVSLKSSVQANRHFQMSTYCA